MTGTTLKYFTKQASVEQIEASFNSDYSRLLSILEDHTYGLAQESYAEIIEMFVTVGISAIEITTAAEILSSLFQRVYIAADTLYRPWYSSAFNHLSKVTPQEFAALYAGAVSNLSNTRAASISPAIVESIRTSVNKPDFDPARTTNVMSSRFSRTETNGAAGSIVEATAASMFADSTLYKRWLSVGDERVRFTHARAAARKPIPANQLYQVGDVFMRFPSDPQAFGGNVAGEVVNCRCRNLILPFSVDQPNSNSLNQFLTGL